MSKILQPESGILNEVSNQSKFSTYEKFMMSIIAKFKGEHPCNNNNCNKTIASKFYVCKGCKCAFYCSRKCQKIDWMKQHRTDCISTYSGKLTSKQKVILERAHHGGSQL